MDTRYQSDTRYFVRYQLIHRTQIVAANSRTYGGKIFDSAEHGSVGSLRRLIMASLYSTYMYVCTYIVPTYILPTYIDGAKQLTPKASESRGLIDSDPVEGDTRQNTNRSVDAELQKP